MGLIAEGDRRPRDWGYRVAFDRKVLPSLEQMIRHIQESHDIDMIEDFNLKCEQKLAGQTAVLDNDIELKGVTKTEDLVVNAGLAQCVNIILGDNNRFARFGFTRNNGNNPPQITNTALDASIQGPQYTYLNLIGWREAKGMKLFYGTITPQDVADLSFNMSTVHEMGISTSDGILLNRELFFNNPSSRSTSTDGQMYKYVLIFSCVIEFCPVA